VAELEARGAVQVIAAGDFQRLWFGQSISQIGTHLSLVALPVLAVESLHANEGQMGVLTACGTLAFLLVGLPAGAWVDRWHKRRVLVAGDVLRALLYGWVPLAWWLGILTLWQLFAVATLAGVGTVFFDVAYQSYLPHLVEGEDLVSGNARLQASESVAQVAGPAAAGGLLRVVSAPFLIGLDALSFLASALFVSRIRRPETTPARDERRPLRTEVAEGLGFVLRHPLLRQIIACTALINLFSSMAVALYVLFVLRDLGLTTGVLGLVFSAAAVGGLLGALTSGWVTRVVGAGRTIPVTALLMAPATALDPLAALVSGPWPVVLLISGGVLYSAFLVIYNITQISYRQRACPPKLLGRMNASMRFIGWGALPIGALIGGLLGAEFGILPVLWLTVAGAALSALPVVFSPLMTMKAFPDDRTTAEAS
jgi:MFS family permease